MIKRLFNRLFPKRYTFEEACEMAKQHLIEKGAVIGDKVDIVNSTIEDTNAYLIKIGDNVTIANARILTHDASTKKIFGYTKVGKVEIGNNVFIGLNSVVLPGTKIGDNVIVGAGTVCRGNIEGNQVIMGNPYIKICDYETFVEKHKTKAEKNCYDMDIVEVNDEKNIAQKNELIDKGFGYFL